MIKKKRPVEGSMQQVMQPTHTRLAELQIVSMSGDASATSLGQEKHIHPIV